MDVVLILCEAKALIFKGKVADLLDPPHVVEGGTHGSYYGEAFAIVKRIRALHAAHEEMGMFGDEFAEIQLKWKRKRNFLKLLDAL